MLTELRSAVGTWRPAGGRVDPLLAVSGAWPAIVGEAVARSSQPVAIEGETLVVLTASSAWNQQLSFLAEEIVSSVRAVAGVERIARLRLRVGTIRRVRPAAAAAGRAPTVRAIAPGGEPARSLDEALERMRTAVERLRDAKTRAGWKTCTGCGGSIAAGVRCGPCSSAATEERSRATQRLMFDVPWLGYGRTAELVEGLTLEEYEAIRRELLSRWWASLGRVRAAKTAAAAGNARLIASSYILLHTGWEPDRITPAVAKNILGDEIFALVYERERLTH